MKADNLNEKTFYLYKSASELSAYLELSRDDHIITQHSDNNEGEVERGITLLESTPSQASERTINKIKDLLVECSKNRNTIFWEFSPTSWADDLSSLGIKRLSNPFNMFRYFDNKLIQSQHLKSESLFLRKNIELKEKLFKTEYHLGISLKNHLHLSSSNKVISNQFSEGGSGVRINLASEKIDIQRYNSRSAYRVEEYIEGLTSVNQSAIVFDDGIVPLKPTEQIIKIIDKKLCYSGSSIFENRTSISRRI